METEGRRLVQVKLDAELVKQLDLRAVEEDQHRYEVMEDLLRRGLAVAQGGAKKAMRMD